MFFPPTLPLSNNKSSRGAVYLLRLRAIALALRGPRQQFDFLIENFRERENCDRLSAANDYFFFLWIQCDPAST